MKIQSFALRISVVVVIMASTAIFAFGQKNDNGIILKFTRQSDGHIASHNAVDQKVFPFIIEGIATQQQADDFIGKFKGNKFVATVNISDPLNNGNQRKGVFVIDRKATMPNFKALLIDAGINYIYVDEKLVSVEKLETLKTNTHVKHHK